MRRGIALLGAGGRIVCLGAAERRSRADLQRSRDLRFAASFGFPHPIPLLMRSKSLHRRQHAADLGSAPRNLARCLRVMAATG